MIPLLSIPEITILYLASIAEQFTLCLNPKPKDNVSRG